MKDKDAKLLEEAYTQTVLNENRQQLDIQNKISELGDAIGYDDVDIARAMYQLAIKKGDHGPMVELMSVIVDEFEKGYKEDREVGSYERGYHGRYGER